MNTPANLVYIDEYNLLGSNFYWHKYEVHGLTKEDILSAGLTSERVQVSSKIIEALINVDKEFRKRGWRLYVKEGYRSESLYKMIYERRVAKYGKEVTDSILNIETMPHSKGTSVDVAIWDIKTDKEIFMRNKEDGVASFFVHFYRGKQDEDSKRLQELQDTVTEIMMDNGFRFASKREYFHFDYNPDIPFNYN